VTLLLRDDKGVLHTVESGLRPDDCPDLIYKAKQTMSELEGPPPIMVRLGNDRRSRRFYAV